MNTLSKGLLIAVALSQIGCGTVMYPHRRFQNRTGQIDASVVEMDAAWILVFVVPGAVALLVDFVTGAIYVPEGQRHFLEPRAGVRLAMLEVFRGTHLEVRTPDGAFGNTHWKFELLTPASSAVLAFWSWSRGSTRVIQTPDSLAPGAYQIRVTRDSKVVGSLPIRVLG